jgi:hypothetical protein
MFPDSIAGPEMQEGKINRDAKLMSGILLITCRRFNTAATFCLGYRVGRCQG